MATAEEGGATAKATTSSYGGGGGVGGKFRKKPFRRPTTPYDRPSIALRGNDNDGGWLTKLVVEPASKLISYGAHRLFASVFRKRLPPVLPTHTSESDQALNDGPPERVPNNQYIAQEPTRGECIPPMDCSSSGISELEQLLKQKTFTRSEIDHLTKLLQSKAGENKETSADFEKHKKIESIPFEENRNEENEEGGSHGARSTPIFNSKVLEDDIASPAEVAKAYMGSRPSKVSSPMLEVLGQVSRKGTGLLGNTRFASNSPIMSLTRNTSVSLGASEKGFITPRSRGRSAIYQMSRSRVHPASTLKGSEINNNGFAGSTMPSSSLSLVENDLKSKSKLMTLKRRSSVLDDEVGSVGPIRRIRQKYNIITPRVPRAAGVRIDSDAVRVSSKQKLPLIGESKQFPKAVGEYADNGVRSTSYAHVPSKSSEVAARIFQHLEKLTPKEKSSESKLVAAREKSPFKLTPSLGKALRSMEDVGSSKLLLDIQDDQRLENRSNATIPDARDVTSQKLGKGEENGHQGSVIPSDKRFPVMDNDPVMLLKTSRQSTGTSNSVVKSGISEFEHTQKKRGFRMSAQEGSLELDDDLHGIRLPSIPFFEGRRLMEAPLSDSKLSPAQEPKLVKNTIEPELKSPSDLILSKTTELSSPGAVTWGEGSTGTVFPALQGAATAAAQSAILPLSVPAFDKPKEASSPPPLFKFNSKVTDKFPSLTSDSSDRMPETKPESYGSLVDVAAPTGSLVKTDTIPSAESNGRLISGPPNGPFTAAFSSDANHMATGGPLCFSPSTSIENIVPTCAGTSPSAAPGGSIFESTTPPSVLGGPVFKFGASVEPSTAVPAAASTMISPLGGYLKTKAQMDPSPGSTSNSLFNGVAFGAASSGSSTFGIFSSTANNLRDSLFASASKSLLSGVGTLSQGPSVQSVSSAPSPSFNTNISTSLVPSSFNSQVFNPKTTFDFNSSASTSDNTGGAASSSGPTSSALIVSATSTAISDSNAVSSSSGATPSVFNFGFSSSSSLTSANGSARGIVSPFSFGGSSSVSASIINTASSFGASSSAPSPAINSVSSSGAPNAFSSSISGSTLSSASPSTGFSNSALATSSAPTSAAPMAFNSSTGPSSRPIFSFTTTSSSTQPVFGNPPFAASAWNNNQMSTKDSMAEDPVQAGAPSVPLFSQPAVSPPLPGFMFSSTAPSPANPFQFGGQQNQVAPQNPSPFQASGSLEFNAGGSFSLGSGGGDKSGRKFVKINRYKNRRR